ncbi:MAG: hypothetical protein A3F78_11720 [Burkholderiales bacterium RIFCSPLOWO2_12_FULL_61_40]|nr:MAG: hypothetical protein A3F78_11720 [Burkholderiales bacterium RIFCSPLOWO2_12_FULL_61_40]
MTIMSDLEAKRMPQNDISIGWAAGFFDGDGYTSISKQRVKDSKNLTYLPPATLHRPNCKETLLHAALTGNCRVKSQVWPLYFLHKGNFYFIHLNFL